MARLLEPYQAQFESYCAEIGAIVPSWNPIDKPPGEFVIPADVLSIVVNSANSAQRLEAKRAAGSTRRKQERKPKQRPISQPVVLLNLAVPTKPQGIFVSISPNGELVGWAGERGQTDSAMALDVQIDDLTAQVVTKDLWRPESVFRRRYSFQVPHGFMDGRLHRVDIRPTGFQLSVQRCPCYFALNDEACLIASPLQTFAGTLRGAVVNPWRERDEKAVVQVRLNNDRLLEAVCDQSNPEEYNFPGGSFGFSLDLGDATVSQIESIWLRHPAAGLNVDATSLLSSGTSRSEPAHGDAEDPIFADFDNAARVDI
jgi:hypothetical protein